MSFDEWMTRKLNAEVTGYFCANCGNIFTPSDEDYCETCGTLFCRCCSSKVLHACADHGCKETESYAELLEFAEQFVKWAYCPREEKDNLIELAEQAIARAKKFK